MNKETFYKNIREQGGRITKIRSEIIRIMSDEECLISSNDLLSHLKKLNVNPNRSTIYRELQFLTKNNVIIKNTISGVDYYEIPHDHHHHLVCLGCNSISKVEISNHLEKQEKQIAKQNKFNIINHSLEFYGYCHKCQA
jgi:Fur family ferric uptake transcriptional regulator